MAYAPGESHLPYALDTILGQYGVARNNGHLFKQRLGSQQPVKRVAVTKRESLDLGDMPEIYAKQVKAVSGHLVRDEPLHRLGETKFAKTGFYGQLPTTGKTQETFVTAISNHSAGFVGKERIVGEPPKEGMGIEQQPHQEYSAKSVGVSSKSGAT